MRGRPPTSSLFPYTTLFRSLPDVKETLRFTPEVLADIFLGKITKWSDARIASASTSGVKDRKSTRLNSSHTVISYAVFCLKKKKNKHKLKNSERDGHHDRRD